MDEYDRGMVVKMFSLVMRSITVTMSKDEKELEELKDNLIELSKDIKEWAGK